MLQRTAVIAVRTPLPPTAACPAYPAPTRRPANLTRKLTLKLSHPPELTRPCPPCHPSTATLRFTCQYQQRETSWLTLAPRRPDNTHVKATTHFAYCDNLECR